jgi:hypothetical protein
MPSGHRPQPPVGTARVAISGYGDGVNPWVNVFWLSITATTHVAADLKNIIDTMVGDYQTRFAPSIENAYGITGAKASWLYASNTVLEYQGSYADGGSNTGGVSNDAMCSLINWAITDYYRGGHPRTYLPGTPQSKITNGRTLDATYASTLATAANNFLSDVNALTHGGISAVTLGTVRFASGNAWLSPPVFKPYQSASVRQIVAIQRRRLAAR